MTEYYAPVGAKNIVLCPGKKLPVLTISLISIQAICVFPAPVPKQENNKVKLLIYYPNTIQITDKVYNIE